MLSNRRQFIRQLLSTGLISQFDLDVDKLLWIPGAKKIFIPSPSDLKHIFESDDWFYNVIQRRGIEVSGRPFTIPLQLNKRETNG